MNCLDCNIEMVVVFFRYENGECFVDGKKRFLCEICGNQKLVEKK